MPHATPRSGRLPDLLRRRRVTAPWWRRALYVAGAVLAIAVGIAGIAIPLVSGIPFWIAGIVLLAMASARTVRIVNSLERRLPTKWRLRLRRALSRVPLRSVRNAVNLRTS